MDLDQTSIVSACQCLSWFLDFSSLKGLEYCFVRTRHDWPHLIWGFCGYKQSEYEASKRAGQTEMVMEVPWKAFQMRLMLRRDVLRGLGEA